MTGWPGNEVNKLIDRPCMPQRDLLDQAGQGMTLKDWLGPSIESQGCGSCSDTQQLAVHLVASMVLSEVAASVIRCAVMTSQIFATPKRLQMVCELRGNVMRGIQL